MKYRFLILTILMAYSFAAFAQTKQAVKWQTVSNDKIATISYNPKITNAKNGYHVVWVKADYKTSDWQWYFAQQVGLKNPVYSTKTKVWYDKDYNYCMVRQVLLFNKSGKQVYNSGEDDSAGWTVVNAADPVGIVGEYLGSKLQSAY